MTPIILPPFVYRILAVLIFLFIPTAIVAPHGIVWEIILTGLIGLYYSRKQPLAVLPQPIIAILIAIPLWGLMTTLWAKYPIPAMLMSLKIVALVVLGIGWCRLILSLPRATQQSLINAFIGGLLLSLILLILDMWFGNPWQIFMIKSSSKAFSQGSLLISLAVWPAIFWVLQRPYSMLRRVTLLICLFVSIFWTLFQIDCDTSFVGLFLGICVFGGTLVLPRITSLSMRLILPLLIIAFPLICQYAFKPEQIPTYNTYIHSPSYLDRLYIWNDVAGSIMENPWGGIGMDGTPYHEKRQMMREWSYIDDHKTVQKTKTARFSIHPHNAILQLWLELGFVGVILGVLLTHITLFQIYRTNLKSVEKAVCAGLFTGTFVIVWINLGFWQNWWISGLWIIIGLTITMFKDKREIDERHLS